MIVVLFFFGVLGVFEKETTRVVLFKAVRILYMKKHKYNMQRNARFSSLVRLACMD